MLEAPEHFLEDVFLTQSDALGGMLTDQLTRVTKRIIREEDAREINDRTGPCGLPHHAVERLAANAGWLMPPWFCRQIFCGTFSMDLGTT
jgi:hypothetical protein